MKLSKWDLRIERSDYLTREHPFAGQALEFFKSISKLQAQLYFEVERLCGNNPPDTPAVLRQGGFPIEEMLPRFPDFLAHLEAISP
jgi:hypothetical protein